MYIYIYTCIYIWLGQGAHPEVLDGKDHDCARIAIQRFGHPPVVSLMVLHIQGLGVIYDS